jgi:hypothetical protein
MSKSSNKLKVDTLKLWLEDLKKRKRTQYTTYSNK